jgi:transposase
MNTRRNVFHRPRRLSLGDPKEYSVKAIETHRRCVRAGACRPAAHRSEEAQAPDVYARPETDANLLKNCQVTEIAMESTGQYWRPLWNLLEGEFARLVLVNPQHIKGLNGHKTDPRLAQTWPAV